MVTKRKRPLLILDILAGLLFVGSFTPLVIPMGKTEPNFLGMPYTMWMGFLVSVLFVLLAYGVSRIQKRNDHAD
ncbi:hypothetical protein [Cytophaga sp. FL35]|uniref:hypothetical protein n=1 Tax=Cytophaga sp. FL35 TaxID=1904456 RepID=UPI001653DDB1|nr:hypothetical protein [Cytophaga sp. FL35]MBC6998474.1 hypothetical protein [Cytophaga sp. FL35]